MDDKLERAVRQQLARGIRPRDVAIELECDYDGDVVLAPGWFASNTRAFDTQHYKTGESRPPRDQAWAAHQWVTKRYGGCADGASFLVEVYRKGWRPNHLKEPSVVIRERRLFRVTLPGTCVLLEELKDLT